MSIETTFSIAINPDEYDRATKSDIFTSWLVGVEPEFKISGIDIKTLQPPNRNPMFEQIGVTEEGIGYEQIVQLMGDASAIFVELDCGGELYTALVVQPRLPAGQFHYVEVPAGKVEGGTFQGTAAKELAEELELEFEAEELTRLDEGDGIYSTPGLVTEKRQYFLARKKISLEELQAMQGKKTGVLEEGERITVQIMKIEDLPPLHQIEDANTLIAIALYYEYIAKEERSLEETIANLA